MGRFRNNNRFEDNSPFEDNVVQIYRCSKVVKGGRRFSFAALVVVGDRNGKIGMGYGKANEVPNAVEKAVAEARKSVIDINLRGSTIPHPVKGQFGASTVLLVPASPGTGVIAGKKIAPMLHLAGIADVLTKAHGSTCPKNIVKATLNALKKLRTRDMVAELRGVTIE
ncbi:MAG: 30S ribosomal protein S5 [Phycisphaerae bacterium]